MTKQDLEKHLQALTFRHERLVAEHAQLKKHYEKVYQHYKHLIWRFYFK